LCRFALEDQADDDQFHALCRRVADSLDGRSSEIAPAAGLLHVAGSQDRCERRLAVVEALAKAGFDPSEPRNQYGEWEEGGGAAATASVATMAADAVAAGLERRGASLSSGMAPRALAGLAGLAAGLVAPVAFLGIVLIPTNGRLVRSGTVPGRPDVSYSFNQDTGILALELSWGSPPISLTLFEGVAVDGIFRDKHGTVYGRLVDQSILLDPEVLPVQEARSASSSSRAQARARANERTRPQLCPAPKPDRPGADLLDWAYQAQIGMLVNPERGPLPPGIAVRPPKFGLGRRRPDPNAFHDWVHFDDCRLADGTMIDAKGTGIERYFRRARADIPG
jgi:hypothetical protein